MDIWFVGCFNLDPNRVLDIILESFESRPERWQLFIPLLRAYMPNGSIICEVLGYKFRYFADSKTPRSLFHVCSLLLKYGVIDLNDIYVWVSGEYNFYCCKFFSKHSFSFIIIADSD